MLAPATSGVLMTCHTVVFTVGAGRLTCVTSTLQLPSWHRQSWVCCLRPPLMGVVTAMTIRGIRIDLPYDDVDDCGFGASLRPLRNPLIALCPIRMPPALLVAFQGWG